MKIFLPTLHLLAMAILALSLAGCGGRGGTSVPDVIDEYHSALASFPGSTAQIEAGLERFADTYRDLTAPDLAERVRATYAEALFFNDTLHSFHALEDLVDYMRRTGVGLSSSEVEVHQVLQDGQDVYVRWTMEFRTRAAGRDIHSRSIGMTHLRFDDQGRVIVHQDFWDSGHALYAHLPLVGFAVRRARAAM